MKRTPVVVTGVGVICPLGRDKEEFWTNLVAGRSGVRPATDRDFQRPAAAGDPGGDRYSPFSTLLPAADSTYHSAPKSSLP